MGSRLTTFSLAESSILAINRSKRGIEGASENASFKIIMDVKELKFLDNIFE